MSSRVAGQHRGKVIEVLGECLVFLTDCHFFNVLFSALSLFPLTMPVPSVGLHWVECIPSVLWSLIACHVQNSSFLFFFHFFFICFYQFPSSGSLLNICCHFSHFLLFFHIFRNLIFINI